MKIISFTITNCLGFSEEGLTGQGTSGKIKFRDFNLIIGKNDSGKSVAVKAMVIISNLFREWLSRTDSNKFTERMQFSSINTGSYKITQLELLFHNKDVIKKIEFEIEYEIDKILEEKLYKFSSISESYQPTAEYTLLVKGFINSDQGKYFYFHITSFSVLRVYNSKRSLMYSSEDAKFSKDIDKVEYQPLLEFLYAFARSLQSIVYIPPIRDFKEMKFQNAAVDSDEKIREKLSALKEGNETQYKLFKLFEDFVLKLTRDGRRGENRRIVFPKNEETGVSNDMNVLPLSSYGTGIEQLSTMAAHTVMHGTNRLMIIEEPEAHLHPELQRSFFHYLVESQKDNPKTKDRGLYHQYIVLSHSSVFINEIIVQDGQIFRACKKNPATNQTILIDLSTEGTSKALDDLGVKGSDLLQANGIIWLEGPSDRIYIKKWLELYCQENKKKLPRENKDYSIAFYGGSILSWFTMEDEIMNDPQSQKDTAEFINLLKLNRNALVVMDKDSISGKKWDTKQRIKNEIEKQEFPNSEVMVTDGKEIENYLPRTVVGKAFPGLLIDTYTQNSTVAFNDLLIKKKNANGEMTSTIYERNKSDFAMKICENFTISDLKSNPQLYGNIEKIYALVANWGN